MHALALSLLFACKKDKADADDLAPATPMLELQSPDAGAWLSAGATPVRGRSRQMRSVKINGQDALLAEDGSFQGEATLKSGVNLIEARGRTVDGDELYARHGVLAGSFEEADGRIAEAAVVRLNQGGLDVLAGMVGGLLDETTVNGMLSGINPVYEDAYGFWGWDAVTIAADIESVAFGTPVLALQPSSGKLRLSGSIPSLDVDAQAYGEAVGIDFDTDVAVWASSVDISGDLSIAAQSGRLVADVSNVSVTIIGFGYDTSLLPGSIEDYILVDTLQSTLEEQLLAMIEEQVPSLLDDALSGLDLSMETKLLGQSLSIDAVFSDARIDDDGVLLSLGIGADMPGAAGKGEGVLRSGMGEPTVDRNAHLAAAFRDDLLNRLLYEAWAADVLSLSMNTYDGSLYSFLLTPLKATEGSITVRADLPPVLVEVDGKPQLQVAELMVAIETPDGELGTRLLIAAAAFIDVEIVHEDGELKLQMGEVELSLMVRDSDWGASNEAVTALVEEMLPLDTLLALVGNLAFPVPEIQGLSLQNVKVGRDVGGDHISMTASLGVAR